MKLLRRVWAWYQRRFRGYVAAPKIDGGGSGTAWQEHVSGTIKVDCRCGATVWFEPGDYFVRERDPETKKVLSARYCKICKECGLGHWWDATPETEERNG